MRGPYSPLDIPEVIYAQEKENARRKYRNAVNQIIKGSKVSVDRAKQTYQEEQSKAFAKYQDAIRQELNNETPVYHNGRSKDAS